MQTIPIYEAKFAAWLREQPIDRIFAADEAEGCPLGCYLDAIAPADAPHAVFYEVVQTKDEDDYGDAKKGRRLPVWAIKFYCAWDSRPRGTPRNSLSALAILDA